MRHECIELHSSILPCWIRGTDMKLGEALQSLGRPVAYFPELARFLGSIEAAILLAQLCYWKGKTEHEYLYTTDEKLEEETALTPKELRRARKLLTGFRIIAVTMAPLRHESHYIVDLANLELRWKLWKKSGGSRRPKREGLERGTDGKFVPVTDRERTLPTDRERTHRRSRKRTLLSLEIPQNSPDTPPPHCSPPGETGAPSREIRDLDAVSFIASSSSETGRDIAREEHDETSQQRTQRIEKKKRLLEQQGRELAAQEAAG